jgi:transcriptional regulator with XRE-family HTH domain
MYFCCAVVNTRYHDQRHCSVALSAWTIVFMSTKTAAPELSANDTALIAREPVAWYLHAAEEAAPLPKPVRLTARQAFMKQFGQRCKLARGRMDIGEVADKIGVHRNTIWNIERGESLPDAFELELLAGVYRTTAGALLSEATQGKERHVAFPAPRSLRAVEIGGFVHIPHFDVEAATGKTELFGDIDAVKAMRPFDVGFVRGELGITHAEVVLIKVTGDSMAPILRSKDTVMIDLRSCEVFSEGVHVLRVDDAMLIKRVQRLPGKMLRITSENPDYEPFEIRANDESSRDFQVIGRVVWGGVTFK